MEFNKGVLIPVDMPVSKMRELMTGIIIDIIDKDDDWIEDCFRDEFYDRYIKFDGSWYRREQSIESTDCCQISYGKKNDDGSIEYMTYHYNGGGCWTEVLSSAIKDHEGEFRVY